MNPQNGKRKVLDSRELQKLGVIGVLIFVVNFLMNFIDNDREKFERELKDINTKVSTVIVKQEILTASVQAGNEYNKKDLNALQKQIDSLSFRVNSLENNP